MLALGAIFFLAEFGDKTQIATLSLAGLHSAQAAVLVWLGATGGMLAANVISIAAGTRLHRSLPPRLVRLAAGAVFIAVGLGALILAFR